MSWYRNARCRVYHAAAPDWVATGLALCGARIVSPAFAAHDLRDVQKTGKHACLHCARLEEK